MGFTIDDRDKAILREMQADASITNASLAKKIGLSASACLARTDNLIKTGVIKQFTAIVDEHKLGIEMFAYALINLVSMKPESIAAFMEYVNGCPQLQECYTAPQLVGLLAHAAGLIDRPERITPRELVPLFSWDRLPRKDLVWGPL